MHRRDLLSLAGLAAVGGAGSTSLFGPSATLAQDQGAVAQAARGLKDVTITDVKTILTAPAGIRLVIVKVETSEPGLHGVGCATFTQRARVVETAVQQYLRPFMLGKNALAVEDFWQSAFVSSYWRNGPVLNNAISGIDMALWDIIGKCAGLPVYQLIGGKCREGADTYRHASGGSFEEVQERVERYKEEGYRHIRIQVAIPELSTYGSGGGRRSRRDVPPNARTETWEPAPYVRTVPKLFEHIRKTVGDEVELLHDIHERVPPILAMQLVRDVEQYRPYFMEDPFSPEDIGYFTHLRKLSSTPIAMGELFNNPHEWVPLISGRLIDFIRCHISQIGGITMARKIAALGEFFAVRTAWHGPGDTSPVGHAANVHLDLACPNFGVQEARQFNQAEHDVFPGCPELRDGYYYANDQPGLGIDIDEQLAARFPIRDDPPFDMDWGNLRRRDGSITKP
ncbi:MAG: enolase C-terminal domain-like protein [Pirellulales bacterium]